MRLNRDEGVKEFFGYESDRRRILLICTNCVRKSFVFQIGISASMHQWNAFFSTNGLSMQPHSARVCNKLLSELVMINTKVTSNLSLCFIDSDDSDS